LSKAANLIVVAQGSNRRFTAGGLSKTGDGELWTNVVVSLRDPAPTVRGEVALTIPDFPHEKATQIAQELVARYDGRDRFYLEALGVGCKPSIRSRLSSIRTLQIRWSIWR